MTKYGVLTLHKVAHIELSLYSLRDSIFAKMFLQSHLD